MAPTEFRYRAFISYSHRDKVFASWLHRTLEGYHIPSKLVGRVTRIGPVPRRLAPIFRDRDELPASGDLGGELRAALAGSQFLLVICSPASARSHWVHEEILAFKRLHGDDRVLAVIVAGEPYASANPATVDNECFPRSLRMKLGPDGELSDEPAEPIAADIRKNADGKQLAKLKLIAGLTGLKLDDIAQRETQRRMRRLVAFATAASVGMIFAILLAAYANARRIEANVQRRVAEQESATARAASDFLVGTFALSNPATDNPRTVTALSILGRSADRARTELAKQPVVQARLIATLGLAYANLGLFNEAREAIGRSMPAVIAAGPDGAEARLVLAFTDFRQGRQDEAMRIVRQVQAMPTTASPTQALTRAKAALLEGQLHGAAADIKGGVAAFDRAVALYRASNEPVKLAGVLVERGALLSDAGRFAEAEASLGEALAINRRVLGDSHLATGQSWYAYAQNAFLTGNLPVAETRIAHALQIERKMLDDDNPVIADALSMPGPDFPRPAPLRRCTPVARGRCDHLSPRLRQAALPDRHRRNLPRPRRIEPRQHAESARAHRGGQAQLRRKLRQGARQPRRPARKPRSDPCPRTPPARSAQRLRQGHRHPRPHAGRRRGVYPVVGENLPDPRRSRLTQLALTQGARVLAIRSL